MVLLYSGYEEFATRVQELTAIFPDRALKFGLAHRLAVLSYMHERIFTVIDARSIDPELAEIPGG
jgi:hypothetical protein